MILKTRRLWLELPDMLSAGIFAQWLNDPEIVKYSEQRHHKHTEETQRDYWNSAATVEPNFVYSIYLHTRQLIGSIAAEIDRHNNIANVGILIGEKSLWGQGYGFEAWESVCNHLFIAKKIRKVVAGCMGKNTGMIKICDRYGMKLEAVILSHFQHNGDLVSLHLYGKSYR